MLSPPSLVINDKAVNVLNKNSKDYYSLLLCKKAQFPNRSLTLKREFDLAGEQIQKVYILPPTVCCEPYIKAFQWKVLTSIFYTNTKWVRFPPRSKDFFFTSCGSLIPFTRANAQWVFHGFHIALLFTLQS